jgi:PAS domain S-box-containing protein
MAESNLNKEIFFDLSVELFIVINKQAVVEEVNESWALLGYTRNDLIGKPYAELVLEDDRNITQAEGERLLSTGLPMWSFENRIISKNGEVRWISWAARGNEGYMYAAGRDITELKLQQEKEALVRQQMYAFVKQSPAAVALFDHNYRILEYSHRFVAELELPSQPDDEKYTLRQLLPLTENQLADLQEMLKSSCPDGLYSVDEFKIEISGKIRYLQLEFSPWTCSKGKSGGVICVVRDKTAEVQALNEVQIQDLMLKSILENLPVLIFSISESGNFLKCTGAGLDSLGIKESDLSGQPAEKLFPQCSRIIQGAHGKGSTQFMAEIRTNDRTHYFQTYFSYDSLAGGFTGIALDVSDKLKTMKELEKAKVAAEKANVSKSRFLANMSHEMRTPLNLILGFSDLLSKQELLPPQKEFVDYIQSSGQTLIKLIQDILDLSKIEEGKIPIEEKTVFFKQAVTNSLIPYKYKANEKGLNFILQIDEFIPEYLHTDYDKIHQVLLNLIANAIKFTREGEITVSISSEASYASGKEVLVKFSVADTGIGIPAEKQKDIFKSFVQADSSISRMYGGSGLGLSISRQLVKLLGGDLKVISPANFHKTSGGAGSIFYFSLKLKVSKESLKDKAEAKPLLKVFSEKYRVLVAEDNIMNQKLAEVILRNFGCEVAFASNGREAVELAENEKFDLVLMDVQMPLMNGIEATRTLRLHNKTIPVIGLTAHVFKEDIEEFRQAGMNDFLGKPYRDADLYEVISKWTKKL